MKSWGRVELNEGVMTIHFLLDGANMKPFSGESHSAKR